MFKNMIRNELARDEVNLNLVRQVKRAGGYDALSEADAKCICTICHIKPEAEPSDEEKAYQEFREIEASLKFWRGLRAEIGEAHDFGEMCGYNQSGDEAALKRYNAEIAKLEARKAEITEAARKGAAMNGRVL